MVKLMLIDGNSLANRAFYAVPPLTNREGFTTNAIYGFLNMLSRVRKEEKPDYLAVAFDAGKVVFRHQMYENYKGSRKATPDELKAQFPVLREVLTAIGVPWLELEGYEADDLIGTLAAMGSAQGMSVSIITGDRDCFQLIDDHVSVLFTRKGISELELFDAGHLQEVYGLEPWQIVELKGLMGDSSDDIPGIPGVGEKTALKLLNEHESVEGVLAAAGDYAGKKLGEKLVEHGELARLSRELAKIDSQVPLDISLESLLPKEGDREEKIRLFRELEFKGMLAEALKEAEGEQGSLPGQKAANIEGRKTGAGQQGAGQSKGLGKGQLGMFEGALEADAERNSGAAVVRPAPRLLTSAAELRDYLAPLQAGGRLYILPVTKGQGWRSFDWQGLGLMKEGQEPVWLEESAAVAGSDAGAAGTDAGASTDGAGTDGAGDVDAAAAEAAFGPAAALPILQAYLEASQVTKIFIDAKQAYLYFRAAGSLLQGPYEDLHLMSYLLNPANPWQMLAGLEELEPAQLIRSGKEAAKLGYSLWTLSKAAGFLEAMEELAGGLRSKLEGNNLWQLYKDAEEPLALILGEMEWQGICLDSKVLREQGLGLKEKIAATEEEIHQMAEVRFNINSPKQLGEVLFEKMGLSRGKKTKTGYSTDAETLEYLAAEHEIARKILEYRQYTKLQSTYIEGLMAIADPLTGKIHTSLNQTITVTGRLSSTEPNLQNIPIRMEEGRQIRRAFVPSPGCCLLSGDYSQIELRVLAHFCGDEALQQAFRQGQDIHRSTAAEVFGVDPEAVTPALRRAAKAVNFGLIYGISDFGLAQDLGIARGEAKAYMDRYFSRYPGVKRYFDHLLLEAAEKGYVETMFHRRRYLPELKSANFHTRSFGQRAAMNAPLQGTAADIMKLAMIGVKKLLEQEGLGQVMVLQVHDELLFDMPREKALELKDKIRNIMENVVALEVPLQVDMKMGEDWYAMEAF